MKGEFFRTADLAATIAALVGTEGIDADDALAFRFEGMGKRTAWSFDGKGTPAKLVIEFEGASERAATGESEVVGALDPWDEFQFASAKDRSGGMWGDDLLS